MGSTDYENPGKIRLVDLAIDIYMTEIIVKMGKTL